MVDIHAHILPDFDDGAPGLDESVAMLHAAAAAGTTDIVATPHLNYEYSFDPADVDQALEKLRAHAPAGLRIHPGCELHFTAERIEAALANPAQYALNHRSCVLIEFSLAGIPPHAGDVLGRMLDTGIVPVVAHPERNPLLSKKIDMLAGWVETGVMLQVTAQSLLGAFGRRDAAAARELLRRGLVHFVATDAHDSRRRPPSLKDAFTRIEKDYGPEIASRLFIENPTAAISGRPIEPCPIPLRKRRWFFF